MSPKDNDSGDYVFRYPLALNQDREGFYHDRLTEMIRLQLASLLDLLIPLQQGKEVKIDGFKLLNQQDIAYEVFPQRERQQTENEGEAASVSNLCPQCIQNASLYEPRIVLIKQQLESLLSVVELEKNGKRVEVDEFRLKNLQDWLVSSGGDPAEVFEHLATRCNCNCEFCYLKGNPPSVSLIHPHRSVEEEYQEALTRVKYFSPSARRCLFPTLGGIHEVLAHPYSMDILPSLREKTPLPFRIATNGENLTTDVIKALAKLKPIYIYLSLNSASLQRRQKLMHASNSMVALSAPHHLSDREIPYAVVIVPWPLHSLSPASMLDEMLNDITETVAYADKHSAHLVEINLPGYTQFFSTRVSVVKEKLFDREEVWAAIVSLVRELREKTECPIVVMPEMYEENLYEQTKNLPRAIGLVKNSPAAYSGLRKGDLLLKLNGIPVSNRPQGRDLLRAVQRGSEQGVILEVQRNADVLQLGLNPGQFSYPYSLEIDHHFGIIFMGMGFRVGTLEKLKGVISLSGIKSISHNAYASTTKKVLLLSSQLVRPVLEQSLAISPLFGGVDLRVEVPPNRFFGGNIFMGDLLVVQDFIDYLKEYVEGEWTPDLIVIPSSPFSLGDWGRDITGKVYLEIERGIGIPVALLECETIYD